MTRPRTLASIVAVVALGAPGLAAAAVSAQVDRAETTVEEPILLTVTVMGTDAGEPRLPELPGFTVQTRGQSSQVQIVNGRMSSSVSYNYRLVPQAAGTYTIAPVTVEVGGRTEATSPLVVRVVANGGAARGSARDAFITAEVSNPTPRVGEQVIYTFRFFRRVRVAGAQAQLPDFEGFIAEALGEQTDTTLLRDGESYLVTEMRRALFAQEAGERTVPAAVLTAEVPVSDPRRRSAFDDPFADFFGRARTTTRTLRTQPIAVRVRPLPPAPAGFSGQVGVFDARTALSKHDLAVGESATLEIVVEGRGNVRAIVEPPLPELSAFKVYDDKPEFVIRATGDGLEGRKVFRKALVPRAAGELTLPAVDLVYFDPHTDRFSTARSAPIRVRVRPGEASAPAPILAAGPRASPGKTAVELEGDDILPIHSRARLRTAEEQRRWRQLAAIAAVLPPLVFAGAVVALRRRARLHGDGRLARRRGARRRALRTLAEARTAAAAGRDGEALRLCERAFKSFLGDTLDVAGLALTAAELAPRLAAAHVPETLAARARDALATIEAATYGGGAEVDAVARINEIEQLTRELERTL